MTVFYLKIKKMDHQVTSPSNAGFDFKENNSPNISHGPTEWIPSKRRATTHGDSKVMTIRTRNRAKVMKVLGSTPPSVGRPIPSQKKRKFDESVLHEDVDERSSSSRTHLPALNALLGIAKKLRRDGKSDEGSSTVLSQHRKEATKRIQKRRSGDKRAFSDKRGGVFKVSIHEVKSRF